jgi:hypothetical protein
LCFDVQTCCKKQDGEKYFGEANFCFHACAQS